MSNHLPHFADKGGQLLNLTDPRAGKLLRAPCQCAQEDMDGLRPSLPMDGPKARSPRFRLRIADLFVDLVDQDKLADESLEYCLPYADPYRALPRTSSSPAATTRTGNGFVTSPA